MPAITRPGRAGTYGQLIRGSRCRPDCDDRKEASAGRSRSYDTRLADTVSAQWGAALSGQCHE
ncbi:MAG: hypothetical protein Q9M24_08715 [Mariprofundaceae bacterium]|nr:hypothetical protein [Mariprofundaceae bacterium]